MPHEFSLETSLEILGSVFAPMHCSALSDDHGNSALVSVQDSSGDTLLDLGNLTKQMVTDARRLKAIILEARTTLEQQGVALSAWEFPTAS